MSSPIAWLDHHLPRPLRLAGWRSRWVPTSRGRLHVFDVPGRGTGPPFLLVHGLGCRGADFALFVRWLRRWVRRVVVPDLPGHGWSDVAEPDVEDIRAMLTEAAPTLLPEPSWVLGNSLGGLVAVRIALARPDRVRGLVLASPAGAPMDGDAMAALQRTFAVRTHADAVALVDRLVGDGNPAVVRQGLAVWARTRIARPGVRAILAQMGPEHFFGDDELAALDVPVLLCWGGRDRILAPGQLDYYRHALPPGAVVETHPAYGHAPCLDAPGRFSWRVRRFVEAVEGARGR